MFRVYVEGKSVPDLKNNLLAFAAVLGHGETRVTQEVKYPSGLSGIAPDPEPEALPALPQVHSGNAVGGETPQYGQLASSERDARGIPWDARIHSSSKEKNKDGSWRVRRGADKDEVKAIEASYLGQQSFASQPSVAPSAPAIPFAPQPAPLNPFPPVPSAFAPPQQQESLPQQPNVLPFAPQPAAAPFYPPQAQGPGPIQSPQQPPVQQAQVAYDPIPVPAQAAYQKPAHSFETFKDKFIPTMAAMIFHKELTPEYVEQLKNYFQVKEIMDVKNDDNKCRQLFDTLVKGGKITQVG